MTHLDDARVALEAARAGAAALQPFLGRRLPPTAKGDGSPVTAADQAASAAILAALAALAPADLVVSEEAPPPPGVAGARRVWFVDPLDGTREFVAGIPEFCVMVGLVEAGAPAVGCIVDPHGAGGPGQAWLGVAGRGAFELAPGARIDELADAARARPLRLAPRTSLAGAREVTSRFHEPGDLPRFAAWAGVGARTPCGSMGIKAVRLVTGATDFHLRPRGRTWYWDSAAPAALVLAAGGEVGSATGPLRFDDPGLAHPDGFVLAAPGLSGPLRAAWQAWPGR